ncbi:GNAT family N-acetyltransferase [Streptomyces sp. MN03-5084-2B]|nr:GNAT family N-acetyltransferase [Streptomyces sp. MN03-5084-2B]
MTAAQVLLSDGEVAWVRGLHPADVPAVRALHVHLSDRDRYYRFFGLGPAGAAKLAAHLSDDSGTGHGALGCFLHDRLVGVAQYEVLEDPDEAEIALVVDAPTRAHGVATLLLEHLIDVAGQKGVRRFVADVLAENSKMLGVFAALGLPIRTSASSPERHVILSLDPTRDYRDAVARRAAAAAAARPWPGSADGSAECGC